MIDDSLRPVAGTVVDIWQANANGRYDHEDDPNPAALDPNFQGWAQLRTDASGRFGFKTIVPGAYPVNEEWWRPPHIHVKVARRGYRELITQIYFAGDELNAKDTLLQELTPDEQARLVVDYAPSDRHDGLPTGTAILMLQKVRSSPA